jgi:hypothetical protein
MADVVVRDIVRRKARDLVSDQGLCRWAPPCRAAVHRSEASGSETRGQRGHNGDEDQGVAKTDPEHEEKFAKYNAYVANIENKDLKPQD